MPRYIDFSQQPMEVRLAAHAIGMNNKRPYKRRGKLFYRPYRNHFSTHDKSAGYTNWMDLCDHGYARFRFERTAVGHKYYTFWLTRSGLDWLVDALGITIYDKED